MNEISLVDPKLSLIDAIYQRRSVRGFLDKKIPDAVLHRIFEIAQHTPSNCNVQPWRVLVATGALRDKLRDAMVEKVKAGVPENPDYPYRGDFVGSYRKLQVACAVELYGHIGVDRPRCSEGLDRDTLRPVPDVPPHAELVAEEGQLPASLCAELLDGRIEVF